MGPTQTRGNPARRYPSANEFAKSPVPVGIKFDVSPVCADAEVTVKFAREGFKESKELKQAEIKHLESAGFTGKAKSVEWVYNAEGKRTLFVGLGRSDESFPGAVHQAVAAAKAKKLSRVAFEIEPALANAAGMLVRVCVVSNHQFDKYLSNDSSSHAITHVTLLSDNPQVAGSLFPAQVAAEATLFARELANDRPDEVNPSTLDATAQLVASTHRLSHATLVGSELQQRNLNLISAVGQGARDPPRITTLEYRGNPSSTETIALVGKGITFDTGGLNLKMTGFIEDMHLDMSGAAAVLAAIKAVAALQLRVNVVAVLGLAENAIGSNSYKPLSIYSSRAGFVEVSNTDAEGRLVLADCFSLVQDVHNPSTIIDLATLTGACVVGLGEYSAGLFSNSPELAAPLQAAGDRVHERSWRMPIYPEHTAELENKDGGNYADLKSTGKSKSGGACTAAAFLQKFISPGVQWAHLDIAGPAMASSARDWVCKGGTGFGAQLLVDFLRERADKK